MNLLGGLHKLINRAGNTVHNDVVNPLNRLLNQPQQVAPPQQHIDLQHLNLKQPQGAPNPLVPQKGPNPIYQHVPGLDYQGSPMIPIIPKGISGAYADNPQSLEYLRSLLAKPPPNSMPIPQGWTYGPVGGSHNGWRDSGGVPAILPHTLLPGGLPAQPQWLNPVKVKAFQNRRISV